MKPHLSHDADAERALIGALMLKGGEVIDQVAISPESLHDPRNRVVWEAATNLRTRNIPVDVLTLEIELGPDRTKAIGGLGFLSECLDAVPTAANAPFYAEAVRQHALTREVAEAMGTALSSGLAGEDLLSHAMRLLSGIRVGRSDGSATVGDRVAGVVREMQRVMDGEVGTRGYPTGLKTLDAVLGGIEPGVMTVIGGRPSHGKTALARTLADNLSQAGYPAHVFSLEDSAGNYMARVIADHAAVSLSALRSKVTSWEWSQVMAAGSKLNQRQNWLVDDSAGLSVGDIGMRVRRHRGKLGTRVVVVDYLQLVREKQGRGGRMSRYEEVSEVAQGLARLARDEGVAVIALSQLSRKADEREDPKPQLSDLRESGDIEQVADAVLMVHRPERLLDPSNEKHKTALNQWRGKGVVSIAKNKHGQSPLDVTLEFDGQTTTFRDVA